MNPRRGTWRRKVTPSFAERSSSQSAASLEVGVWRWMHANATRRERLERSMATSSARRSGGALPDPAQASLGGGVVDPVTWLPLSGADSALKRRRRRRGSDARRARRNHDRRLGAKDRSQSWSDPALHASTGAPPQPPLRSTL